MNNHRLQITSVESKTGQNPSLPSKASRRQEVQAAMERLWLVDPLQFDPDRDAVQRKRIAGAMEILKKKDIPSRQTMRRSRMRERQTLLLVAGRRGKSGCC